MRTLYKRDIYHILGNTSIEDIRKYLASADAAHTLDEVIAKILCNEDIISEEEYAWVNDKEIMEYGIDEDDHTFKDYDDEDDYEDDDYEDEDEDYEDEDEDETSTLTSEQSATAISIANDIRKNFYTIETVANLYNSDIVERVRELL